MEIETDKRAEAIALCAEITAEMDELASRLKAERYTQHPIEYRKLQVELRALQLKRWQLETENRL